MRSVPEPKLLSFGGELVHDGTHAAPGNLSGYSAAHTRVPNRCKPTVELTWAEPVPA